MLTEVHPIRSPYRTPQFLKPVSVRVNFGWHACKSIAFCRVPAVILRGARQLREDVCVLLIWFLASFLSIAVTDGRCDGGELLAGTGKVDITDYDAGPVHDPMYAKAIVLRQDDQTVVLITLDAVAIGEIGYVPSSFMSDVRTALAERFRIPPDHVLANASHCHGVVRRDTARLAIQAVEQAMQNLVPVRVGAGVGHEDRISINRRFRLKDGSEADERHAYSTVPDEAVQATGPIDPEIGVLRFERRDGTPVAVLFNFACHPIQGVPGGANTADLSGIACQVIEDSLGRGCTALFLQGCAGDINPVWYKAVDSPRNAEILGTLLAASVLKANARIVCRQTGPLKLVHKMVSLPRADHRNRIAALERRRAELVDRLQGTTLNLKTFMMLSYKYGLWPEYPSYYAAAYLHQRAIGSSDLDALDKENRRNIERYRRNVLIMEEITRLNTNLQLLKKHQERLDATGKNTIDAEVCALRIGDVRLVTFPGELTVEIGLKIKKRSPHDLTFVAGYTNGYIYYAPTAQQLRNPGTAQEDCETILAPEWEEVFESCVLRLLRDL